MQTCLGGVFAYEKLTSTPLCLPTYEKIIALGSE